MFGNVHSGSGSNKRCGRGNIKRAAAVATGTASIEHVGRAFGLAGKHLLGVTPHDPCEGPQLNRSYPPLIQRGEQSHDIGGRNTPGQEFLHQRLGFSPAQDF